MIKKYICPICGYDKLSENPYGSTGLLGSCEICKCCGFEFGVTYFNELDVEEGIFTEGQAIEYYRKIWILTGALWFYETIYERNTLQGSKTSKEELDEILENINRYKSVHWSLANQLKNINLDIKEYIKKTEPIKYGYYKYEFLMINIYLSIEEAPMEGF